MWGNDGSSRPAFAFAIGLGSRDLWGNDGTAALPGLLDDGLGSRDLWGNDGTPIPTPTGPVGRDLWGNDDTPTPIERLMSNDENDHCHYRHRSTGDISAGGSFSIDFTVPSSFAQPMIIC